LHICDLRRNGGPFESSFTLTGAEGSVSGVVASLHVASAVPPQAATFHIDLTVNAGTGRFTDAFGAIALDGSLNHDPLPPVTATTSGSITYSPPPPPPPPKQDCAHRGDRDHQHHHDHGRSGHADHWGRRHGRHDSGPAELHPSPRLHGHPGHRWTLSHRTSGTPEG
jgi:hypothetical protein